jgi:hypothetical protein
MGDGCLTAASAVYGGAISGTGAALRLGVASASGSTEAALGNAGFRQLFSCGYR